ncbi:MBL fold metallo-hydrolase [Arthrobacter sp. NPDC080073]|uniref:MBL fold metallo-hydrolase n=1 Tax=Arthrobacter sp. NPDC080073 TaxID=3155919 RepID=UPI00342E6977
MKITHFGHACLLVEIAGTRVLIDPGTLAKGFSEVRSLDAILISHEHFDHFDRARVSALMDSNPDATLVLDRAIAREVPESIEPTRIKLVSSGYKFDVRGVALETVGGEHATIHPDIPNTSNIGFYFTEPGLLYPGDEFLTPALDARILALPVSGPWQSLADAVNYLRLIEPPVAFAIHEAALTEPEVWYGLIDSLKPASTEFKVLKPRKPTEF